MRLLVAVTASAAMALSAESRVSGPSLGYVLDKESHVVRRIAGIAGSSSLDAPIAFEGVQPLLVSSTGGYAIATGEDGAVSLVLLKTLERVALEGVGSAPDGAVASTSGSAAILYWNKGSRVQIVKGLPNAPAVAFEAQLPGEISVSAVSDGGSEAAFVVKGEDGDTLYTANSDGVAALQKAERILAADYGRRTPDLFFADAAAVYRVRDGNVERLADAESTVGLAAAGNSLLIARAAGVAIVNLSDLSTTEATCGCSVATVRALGNNVFRVTEAMDAPLWILDLNSNEPAFYFIPQAGGSDE
jgi:hypothetical protein